MNRDIDACPLQMLFVLALLLYGLANAMADDKTDSTVKVDDKSKSSKSTRKPKKFSRANGSGPFAEFVPNFELKDPIGTDFKINNLYSSTGMLIMITVPNLTQYEKQKRWEKYMNKYAWPECNAPRKVLVEDLSQQETFKDKVRTMMKEKYQPDGEYVVLIDEDGNVRRQFGVLDNETVILLADSKGNIVHHERDEVEPDIDSAGRLIAQVHKLADAQTETQAAQTHTDLVAAAPASMRTGTAQATSTPAPVAETSVMPLIMTTPLPVRKN